MKQEPAFSLFSTKGERKYLNQTERSQFLQIAQQLPMEKRIFCQLLFYTGARFSEIYHLNGKQFDFMDKCVVLNTLKRRKSNIYRQIPLPDHIMNDLFSFVENREIIDVLGKNSIWTFSPRTGSRIIKSVMTDANIIGINASALGLRHGFAVKAVQHAPINLVQRWMGHAYLSTTSIYLDIRGQEEREWAEKIWSD